MIVRTIHHFSCSGGSLISKCISCMDNVFLLSELHPNSFSRLTFNPFDPIHQLLVKEKNLWTLEKKIDEFTKRMTQAIDILAKNNFLPVLRDHTHSDYLDINKKNHTHFSPYLTLSCHVRCSTLHSACALVAVVQPEAPLPQSLLRARRNMIRSCRGARSGLPHPPVARSSRSSPE